jgi:hypothetical protein
MHYKNPNAFAIAISTLNNIPKPIIVQITAVGKNI